MFSVIKIQLSPNASWVCGRWMKSHCKFLGTIGTDMTSMVRLFARGTEYQSTKEWGQLLYGNILFDIGRLDMEDAHLQENVQAFVKSLVILRPQEYGKKFGERTE